MCQSQGLLGILENDMYYSLYNTSYIRYKSLLFLALCFAFIIILQIGLVQVHFHKVGYMPKKIIPDIRYSNLKNGV